MCVYHIWVTMELGNRHTNETGERRNGNHSPNTDTNINNKNNIHTLLSLTGMESLSLLNLFVTLRHFDRMTATLLADTFPHFKHRPLTTRAMRTHSQNIVHEFAFNCIAWNNWMEENRLMPHNRSTVRMLHRLFFRFVGDYAIKRIDSFTA